MRKRYQLFIFFLAIYGSAAAQCPITVSAGPDKFVCNNGGMVALDGSITGQEIGFRWTPATGLSSNMVLQPTATVTGPATYTLTAAAVDPAAPNLVTNPGFELGNTGFSSGYTFSANPITPGTYILTTSPSLVNSNFPPCDDHTFGNGTGFMMLVNGNGGSNSQVWCQTIPVMPNSWYNLSAWTSTSPISPPALQFMVNNVQVGPSYTPSFAGCSWQEFGATWFSGSATSATICINDISGSGNGLFGDDFVLDDISVTKACTVSDQVNVSVVTVDAVTPASVILGCNAVNTGIILNGSASSTGPGIVYAWDGPSVIAGGNTNMATVDAPGIYTLTVSFDTGDGICSDQANITVLPDPNTVFALAATNEDLSCLTTTASLSGAGSTIGALVTYSWSPAAGVVSGINTIVPEVNMPGEYTLLVTHTSSGCTATATTTVYQNITPATAAASASGTLPCVMGTLTLSGTGSSAGTDYAYQWAGPGIVSGANTLNNCVVNAPGVYTITVTHEISGCTATASATVTQSSTAPVVVIGTNTTNILNCSTDTLVLNSTGSSNGPLFLYQWGTTNGHFSSLLNGPMATIDSAGTYSLTITNTQNGCTSSAALTVTGDYSPPMIAVNLPIPAITCVTDSVQINAGGSSAGNGYIWQWSTGNGTILSGDTTLTPWVSSAGDYILSGTNTINGCISTTSVSIPLNTTPPVAVAGINQPDVLNCINTTVILNSTGSSTDTTVIYQWNTVNGHFAGATNATVATVDSAGMYILQVTNSINGCFQRDTVEVNAFYDLPTTVINPPGIFGCTTDSVQINATGTSAGANFQYVWTTLDGVLLSGDTSLMPWAGTPGTYFLAVTNLNNGCVSDDSVSVLQDLAVPVANINPVGSLNCSTTQLTLQAGGSSTGPNLINNWTFTPAPGASGPGFVTGQNTLTPEINTPGTYSFIIIDTTNFCQGSDQVTVTQDTISPVADAGVPPNIDCSAASALLDGSGSSQGAVYTYLWTGGSTNLQPTITTPGVYTLTVTNTSNFCTNTDSVTVPPFGGVPTVAIAAPATITCLLPQLPLQATASMGSEYVYQWTFTGVGAGITSGDTTLNPTVGSAGNYTLTVLNTQTGCTASASTQVTQSANVPTADAGPAPTILCGVAQVQLDGSLSSNGLNYTYLWSTNGGNIVSGQDALQPFVNAPGTYILLVTDTTNGCTATDNVLVMQDANAPVADPGLAVPITCKNPTVILNGSNSSTGPTITYLWSTFDGVILSGATTLTPEIGGAGTFIFQVTNTANNCSAVASITIDALTQAPAAVINTPQNITCAQSTITLNGNSVPFCTGFWMGPGILAGANSYTPLVNVAGDYVLTVTDTVTGCFSTATVTVNSDNIPPDALAATPPDLNCTQTQTILDGTGSSTGSAFTYLWTGPGIVSGSTTLFPTVDMAGTYMLLVTDITNGCTATTSIVVPPPPSPPVAVIQEPGIITCLQTDLVLSGTGSSAGSGIQYQWSGPGITNGGTTLSPTVASPGVYILTVTDTGSSCTSTAQITVNQNITTPDALAGPAQILTCNITTVLLQGSSTSPGVLFNWTSTDGAFITGQNTATPETATDGTYMLVVTDPVSGCTASSTTMVNMTVPELPEAQAVLPDCTTPTGNITFSGQGAGPFLYSVDGGQNFVTDSVFQNLPPGLYSTLVQDADGCQISKNIELPEITVPEVTLESTVTITAGASVSFNPQINIPAAEIAGIVWSPGEGLSCTDCAAPTANPGSDILYTVLVTNTAGCVDSASILVIVLAENADIYIPNVFSPEGSTENNTFRMFTAAQVTRFNMAVYDRWGSLLFTGNDYTRGWDGAYRGKPQNPGIYIYYIDIELTQSDGSILVKQLKGDVLLSR